MRYSKAKFSQLTFMATPLSYLVAVLLIGCTFYSLHFGLPWSDEGAHILPSYKFLLGQTPFIDDYGPLQLSTLLTYPAFKLFYWLNHHQIDGIFIFERRLYTVIAVICSIYFIRLLSFHLPIYLAILLGINLVSFAPFGLHSPFYDSFAMLFLTLGYFSLLNAAVMPRTTKMYFITGIWLGLAATIYPPLGLSWIFIGLVYPRLSFKGLKSYLAGLAVGVAWLAIVASDIGIKPFLFSLFTLAPSTDPANSLLVKFYEGIRFAWYWYKIILQKLAGLLIALLILRFFQHRYEKTLIWQVLIMGTLLCLVACTFLLLKNHYGNGMAYTMGLFLIAPFLYTLAYPNSLAKNLFRFVWIPSCLTWPTVAIVSGSQGLSTVIALFPGALASILFIILIIDSLDNEAFNKIKTYCIAAVLVFIASAYQAANLEYFYGKISNFNPYCFNSGPFKKLCTSAESMTLIQQIQEKLRSFSNQHKRITVFGVNDIGYFAGNFIPFTNLPYLESPESAIQFFMQKQQYPDIVLIIHNYISLESLIKSSPSASTLLANRYTLYSQENNFSIYTLRYPTRGNHELLQ